MKYNYQIILDKRIEEITKSNKRPSLLLHACCAPCSSYVIEYLNKYFNITILFYNPNITDKSEYEKRFSELQRLISSMPLENNVKIIYGDYEPKKFTEIAKGLESVAEGGERCFRCYRLRLEYTALKAKDIGFDFFTTTLSISPHKNAQVLNDIGKELSQMYGVDYLFSDFKKKNGYKRSCELSATYNLYRQDYCGCIYSKIQSEKQKNKQTF